MTFRHLGQFSSATGEDTTAFPRRLLLTAVPGHLLHLHADAAERAEPCSLDLFCGESRLQKG